MPNLALFPQLKAEGFEIHYIGEKGGMEQRLVSDDATYHGIWAGKLRRYFSLQNLLDLFKLPIAFFQALFVLLRIRPALLFSKGGFVTVPVTLAAWVLRIPLVIHESDVVPGLATKLAAPLASRILTSWPDTASYLKQPTVHTGVALREELFAVEQKDAKAQLNIPTDAKVLLVTGGSQGSEALNSFVWEHLEALTSKVYVLHATGDAHFKKAPTHKAYLPFSLSSGMMQGALQAADFAISRAGSTTLKEFEALGIPAILVPLPSASSRGDQIVNASLYIQAHPTSRLIPEETLSLASVTDFLATAKREAPSSTPNQRILSELLALLPAT